MSGCRLVPPAGRRQRAVPALCWTSQATRPRVSLPGRDSARVAGMVQDDAMSCVTTSRFDGLRRPPEAALAAQPGGWGCGPGASVGATCSTPCSRGAARRVRMMRPASTCTPPRAPRRPGFTLGLAGTRVLFGADRRGSARGRVAPLPADHDASRSHCRARSSEPIAGPLPTRPAICPWPRP